jgi:Ni/Co efflux regulator RcnB
MKPIVRALAISTLALTLTGGVAFAQDHPADQQDHHYVKHTEWKKGTHINHDDWGRGARVDWQAHHLKKPPTTYEWREIDGNYVLASSDGVISSVVVVR